MHELARLGFIIGRILATYDPRYLATENHREEVLQIHLKPLHPTPDALSEIRAVLREEYGR